MFYFFFKVIRIFFFFFFFQAEDGIRDIGVTGVQTCALPIFAGAVQDMVVMFFSMRRDGRSLGQMAREEIGPIGGIAALISVFVIMIILLGVLALVVVNALADSPWGTFSIAMTIPIALFMGFYLRVLRPGRILETTALGVTLLLLAIIAGGWIEESPLREAFTLQHETLVLCLVVYGFVASVLPVWMLL